MRIWKMKVIYGAIILVSLGIIGYTLRYYYGQMGGFDELPVYRLESQNRILVGKRIKSRPTDPAFKNQYLRCQRMISKKEIKGTLTVLTYYDSLQDNQKDQFIGITLDHDMAEVPVDFEISEMTTGERLVVFLPMHPMVRPSPERVEGIILAKAQTDSIDLVPFFNEYHYDDNSMSIEAWIVPVPIDSSLLLLADTLVAVDTLVLLDSAAPVMRNPAVPRQEPAAIDTIEVLLEERDSQSVLDTLVGRDSL